MKLFISLLLSATLVLGQDEAATAPAPVPGPVVSTMYGKIQGGMGESRDGRTYYSFRGVPYGKAPERFANPQAPDTWTDVRNATEPAPKCIHLVCGKTGEIGGIEDCLSLNVFTPRVSKKPSKNG